MGFPVTTAAQVAEHIDALGVRPGHRVAVHSRMLAFGLVEGGPETLVRALLAAIGSRGTLVVPTYTLERGTVYDRASTPSQNVGALPEAVRQTPGAVRSACPMHNHAALGADAALLNSPAGTVSIGQGSDFELLLREGFDLVLLGVGLTEGATFIHHAETLANVPYRTWLPLPRDIRHADGTVGKVTCHYYGRLNANVAEKFDVLEEPMIAAGQLCKVKAPFGASRRMSLASLNEATSTALARDPYALVTM